MPCFKAPAPIVAPKKKTNKPINLAHIAAGLPALELLEGCDRVQLADRLYLFGVDAARLAAGQAPLFACRIVDGVAIAEDFYYWAITPKAGGAALVPAEALGIRGVTGMRFMFKGQAIAVRASNGQRTNGRI